MPSEWWVDVFKFLPRRNLLLSVQPTCRRFHLLAEQCVDNVHVIRHSEDFLAGLKSDLPEANKQFEQLAASDASLQKHFLLVGTWISMYSARITTISTWNVYIPSIR